MGTRPAPIADLSFDSGQSSETRNAVGAAGLALVLQVVMQLATAIDLPALLPGILDQPGLANVSCARLLTGCLSQA